MQQFKHGEQYGKGINASVRQKNDVNWVYNDYFINLYWYENLFESFVLALYYLPIYFQTKFG
jgi:hypothetical protein